ncbi:MAG: hypothetical protein RL189_1324 [Pseudomonadota bacterium]
MKKMGFFRVTGVLLLGGGLCWGAVLISKKFKNDKVVAASQPATADKPVVQVQTVEISKLNDNLIFPGVVRSDSVVAVTTFSEGIVESCSVALGVRVGKGQLLCKIVNDNPSATYLPHAVESPVAGVVGEIHAAVGMRIGKGDKIVTLLRSSLAKVELEVSVQDAARLKVGLPATWTLLQSDSSNSAQAEKVSMRISGVSPLPNMNTRTVKIELVSEKANPGLPGTMGRAIFVLNQRDGFDVSEEAVVYRGPSPFVRTVVDSKVKWVPVSLGRIQMGRIEILGGVKKGDVVVTDASKFLSDGDEVSVNIDKYARK